MAVKQYSKEFKDKIIAEMKAGAIFTELKMKYKLHTSTLYRWKVNAGLLKPTFVNNHDKALIQQIVSDYHAGKGVPMLSRIHKISKSTIYSWIGQAKKEPQIEAAEVDSNGKVTIKYAPTLPTGITAVGKPPFDTLKTNEALALDTATKVIDKLKTENTKLKSAIALLYIEKIMNE